MAAEPTLVQVGVQPGEPWRVRFWSIWLGQACSLIGSALTQFVLLWWITQTTNSASALAVAGVMALLPQAIFGPLGGTLADRLSRRTIMIVTDGISALCMLAIILMFASGNVQLWQVYVLMFIRSTMQAFQAPAAAASTAMLVPEAWLGRVAGFNQALQGIMTVAAAPLGAVALAFLPIQGALTIDLVTALLAITPLLFFSIPQYYRAAADQPSFWQDLRIGVGVVMANRGLLMLYGLVALVVLVIMPTFSLTPLLVKNHFNGGVNEVALMEGLAGVGMILGGILIGFYPLFKRRITTLLLSFAVSCGTVALTALAPSDALLLGTFWWFLSGLTFSTGNAPMMTIIQTTVPNQLQGRVFSLLNTVMGIAGPVGLALAAPLGEALGVRTLFIIGGTLSALICLLGFLSPTLMRIEESSAPKS